jgi:hypothetical protein
VRGLGELAVIAGLDPRMTDRITVYSTSDLFK